MILVLGGEVILQNFEKRIEEEKLFRKKKPKTSYFCVILASCTILVDLDRLSLNMGLYISIVCMIDLSPKYVIFYLSANPFILQFRAKSLFIYHHYQRVLGFHS